MRTRRSPLPLTTVLPSGAIARSLIKATKSPLVLTVNGKAEIVIQDVSSFRETQERLNLAESELQKLKLEALRRDVTLGAEQLKNGEYSEYNDESLPNLLEKIKARGQHQLYNNDYHFI